MPDAQDMDLVREFARHNSEAAFTELVRRHIALVYSVARRCTGNDSDAQDVTQAVFIILARKAAGLRERTLLPGWLYETTRFTAARLLRTNARRQRREEEAYMQSTLNEADTADVWEKLSPHLEAAMSKLAERDRALLVLRFYQNKSGPEAAALMGIREDAAHKRVSRALDKLRKFFTKRGVDSTAATIAETISANSVQAAPVALAKAVTAVALTKGAAASASTLTLIKGALKIMAWTKAKTAIIAGTVVLLAAGTTTIAVKEIHRHGTYPSRTDSGMAATQTARAFFETLNQEDWNKASGFWQAAPPPVDDRFKNTLGGLEVVSVGQPFVDPRHARDLFVPYAVRFKGGGGQTNNLWLWQDTLENRRDSRGAIMNRAKMGLSQFPSKPDGRWYIVGGF